MNAENRLEALILGVGFCLLWSSAFIAGKFSIISAPPLGFLWVRFFFATALMFGLIHVMRRLWRRKVTPISRGDIAVGSLLGLFNNALYLGLCFVAFKTTDAGMVALIASTMPFITALLAKPLLGESLTIQKV
ncbi:MAG: DMT family transporter, partial [Alphaproteobacteria bacterium]|nr:DMT family transporter [Alphaproteobacteria bacterium]